MNPSLEEVLGEQLVIFRGGLAQSLAKLDEQGQKSTNVIATVARERE
jgi:hypothetical protein